MTIQHKDIPDAQRHEPKGISTASSGEVYVADGAGAGTWKKAPVSGWWDYHDVTTQSTVIVLSSGVWTSLTNDGAGANTSSAYAIPGVGNIWNTSTNKFDFSNLVLGDQVDIRIDLSYITSSSNSAIDVRLALADGSGSDYELNFINTVNVKSASTKSIIGDVGIYIGNTVTKNYPAFFEVKSDANATIKVNGFYVRVISYA